MNFFEAKIIVEGEDRERLMELLSVLNQANRKAFAWGNAGGVSSPKEMTEAALLGYGVIPAGVLTSHQEDMVARKTATDMKTSQALAENDLESKKGALKALESKIEKMQPHALSSAKIGLGPFVRLSSKKAKAKAEREQKEKLAGWQTRAKLLSSEIAALELQLASGRFKKVYGGAKLLSQRLLAGGKTTANANGVDAAFGSVQAWKSEWVQSRDANWLFEGDKGTASANKSIKGIGALSLDALNPKASKDGKAKDSKATASLGTPSVGLKIRLTETQAAQRLRASCDALGLEYNTYADVKNKASKYSQKRTASEWIHVGLSAAKGSRHKKKLAELKRALTRTSPEGYAAPVSWRIQMRDGVLYARAQWEIKTPITSSLNLGCLGVDFNAGCLAWAVCTPDGNKPGKNWSGRTQGLGWQGKIEMDLKGLSSNQAQHTIRVAAKKLAETAEKLGLPVAMEVLDFAKRKLEMGRSGKASQRLSSLAYGKAIAAIQMASTKRGVEIFWVDPAYTSVAGFAKYGPSLSLCADRAAAFAIARRGILSKVSKVKGPSPDTDQAYRKKVKGVWIDVRARQENIPKSLEKLAKVSESRVPVVNAVKVKSSALHQTGVVLSTSHGSGRQSMAGSKAGMKTQEPSLRWTLGLRWRAAKSALGSDRKKWGEILATSRRPEAGATPCGSTEPAPLGQKCRPKGPSSARSTVGVSTDLANG